MIDYAGVGISAGAVLFGEIARVTSKKERTGAFSVFMSIRQIGLVIGPAFNLFLRKCNFYLGPFLVDKLRVPAVSEHEDGEREKERERERERKGRGSVASCLDDEMHVSRKDKTSHRK